MPSVVVGAEVRRKRDLNCWPWVRSLIHSPEAMTHSPAAIVAACPTALTSSRCPRALMRDYAEAVLGIVVSDAFDEARQNFLGR